jgi:multicomponent Na+:H+ antiporter subunit D
LLFLNSGSVAYSIETRDLKAMGGLREKMPVTANTNLVASMSIAGIPPFNGFWSKLLIILACLQANRFGYAFCAIVASILTLASFMKVQKYAFFGTLNEKWRRIKEVPGAMRLSMAALAIICVAAGLLLIPLLRNFMQAAVDVLLVGKGYAQTVFGAIR